MDAFDCSETPEDTEDQDPIDQEESQEEGWMEEQRKLQSSQGEFEGAFEGFETGFQKTESVVEQINIMESQPTEEHVPSCPICDINLAGISDRDASVHVNNCLDGNPTQLPELRSTGHMPPSAKAENAKYFQRTVRPPKPAQTSPFALDEASRKQKSAFSRLMSNHAEDSAWATAAAAENTSRGKPAYQRTCPFYKILPGFFICVDAFRYGAVKDCHAYFLSHFHSDHYIGLTSTWSHGPIYCSRATANLVRQQLRVGPQWVVPLEFDQQTEVPDTQGVRVTMIPANHCPGSSLFLFEKALGVGKATRTQRILHCGDFRACRAHVQHPLLRPDVMDVATGKSRQQKIDVCYLDTTYLNPKYAFPSQEDVIQACADMCVSLSKPKMDEADSYETMKRERAGEGMAKFIRKASGKTAENDPESDGKACRVSHGTKPQDGRMRSRLLVVVGTYSIGKERVCLGIAHALGSKIYAPPAKQRICVALEDPELDSLLTSDPSAAQVHMTPLSEIRADTLTDYLSAHPSFSRAVAFRPSGWNYRPPGSRSVESPAVSTVLRSAGWKSRYTMRDLSPQRGSNGKAMVFGVPYSEHSSFRELTMFCCALRIEKIIPTVNVGSAKSRERMRWWVDRWAAERRKSGLFRPEDGEVW